MIDLGQYDARKTMPTNDDGVFTRHRARVDRLELAAYIADYVVEEMDRGNLEVNKWMISQAMDAYEGGAR